MLKSIATSNETLSMLGNGAKLITSKLGGSQKQMGSKLGVQKLTHWKLGGSQKQIGSILKSTITSNETG